MNQNNDNRRRREQRTVPAQRPVSEARVPVLVVDDSQERWGLLQEAVGLLEELVDDVFEADHRDAAACQECAARLDPLIAALQATRDRLAHPERERARLARLERERERLTRLAGVQDREFRRVPGWPAYDVDRAGEYVRSYYGTDHALIAEPYRVLSALTDRATGLPTVTLWRNRDEKRPVAVAALAREVWGAAGSNGNSGGDDDSVVRAERNDRTRRR